jgi:hypothetical protein
MRHCEGRGLQKCNSSALRLDVARVVAVGPLRYVIVAPYGIGLSGPGDILPRTTVVHSSRGGASSVFGVETVDSMSSSFLVDPGVDAASMSGLGELEPKVFRVVYRALFKSISGSINGEGPLLTLHLFQ